MKAEKSREAELILILPPDFEDLSLDAVAAAMADGSALIEQWLNASIPFQREYELRSSSSQLKIHSS